jgi:hypothetical protein
VVAIRSLVLGLVVGWASLACSRGHKFNEPPSTDGGAGGEPTLVGDAGADSGMSGGAPAGGAAGSTEPDPMTPTEKPGCSDDEYDDGNSCQPLTTCGADEFEESPPKADQDRVCVKATQCGDGEYEQSPPSAESDRVCSPLTACGAGTFVSSQPAEAADRVCSPCPNGTFSGIVNAEACTPWAVCVTGESESVPPSPTSNRICSSCGAGKYESNGSCVALTVCSSKQYESTPPTSGSDRTCETLTACQPGSKQTGAPTATTDRQCAACSSGTFSTQVNVTDCSIWSKCKVTEYESQSPNAQRDRSCVSLTVCTSGTRIKTAATATGDRVCEACVSGTFTAASNLSTCAAWSDCAAGFSTTNGTASSDRVCTPCASGKFSSTKNAATCKAWTVCSASQNQTVAGTATSDVVCVDKPVCSTAPDRACTTQCPCASAEGVCTAGNQCVAGTSCVADSGVKVGRAGNTCLATHCNNDQLDGAETSVDCGGECGCRATFEVVALKGLPAGTTFSQFKAMSRDGKRLGGDLGRNRSAFPASIAFDGAVTELETYGKGGSVAATSVDGNVFVGSMGCANPPTCSDTTWSMSQWTGTAAPKVLGFPGNARSISSSGGIIAGDYIDGVVQGFVINGNQRTSIPDMDWVSGITPDGKYVAGRLRIGVQGGLWSAQSQTIVKIGSTDWTSTTLNAVNGTAPAVVGSGYISLGDQSIGFRWKGGVLTELGLLTGGKYTTPNAVAADGGTVVGTTGTNAFQQAFIWTDAGKLRTIVDELKARGLEPAVDLTLKYANYVSDDGKTIVGSELTSPPTFWRVVLQ